MSSNHEVSGDGTKQRLLTAAGEVFAERGFHQATVREICQRAQANIAAVNYHFRDKEGLYAEVLHYWAVVAMQKYPSEPSDDPAATPEQRLRLFIRSFMFRMFDTGRPAWHGKVMARELAEPTGALADLVEHSFRPLCEQLTRIVRALAGAQAGGERIEFWVRSILGQCLYYQHARPVMPYLCPHLTYEPQDIERWVDSITEFSVAAIRALAGPLAAGAAGSGGKP